MHLAAWLKPIFKEWECFKGKRWAPPRATEDTSAMSLTMHVWVWPPFDIPPLCKVWFTAQVSNNCGERLFFLCPPCYIYSPMVWSQISVRLVNLDGAALIFWGRMRIYFVYLNGLFKSPDQISVKSRDQKWHRSSLSGSFVCTLWVYSG